MNIRFALLGLAGPWFLLDTAALRAADWQLTVRAGDFDRRAAIVTFQAPEQIRGAYSLRDDKGAIIPLQVDALGEAVFIEPELSKGATKIYTLAPADSAALAVNVERDGAVLKITANSSRKPILHYQTEPGPVPTGVPESFRHGAFLHPVFSPSGKVVTANHPPDHLHQRGIFFAWTKTEFEGRHPDFWNMGKEKDGRYTGEVRFASVEQAWGGPVQGGFISKHRFIDHTSGVEKDVLMETWNVTATQLPQAHLIDLISTQACAGNTPLKLPKYHYGGLGVRGAAEWNPVDQVTMLTSTGADRKGGDNSKARWVHLGGLIEGQPTGIAVLIHPTNFRFPQPLRLNPKNPQLSVAPSQEGDWEISPGQPYVSRYRFVIVDGAPSAEEMERQWHDYATPPVAEIRKP